MPLTATLAARTSDNHRRFAVTHKLYLEQDAFEFVEIGL